MGKSSKRHAERSGLIRLADEVVTVGPFEVPAFFDLGYCPKGRQCPDAWTALVRVDMERVFGPPENAGRMAILGTRTIGSDAFGGFLHTVKANGLPDGCVDFNEYVTPRVLANLYGSEGQRYGFSRPRLDPYVRALRANAESLAPDGETARECSRILTREDAVRLLGEEKGDRADALARETADKLAGLTG